MQLEDRMKQEAIAMVKQREAREHRVVGVINFTINDVLSRYVGEMSTRRVAEAIRLDVQRTLEELQCRFRQQGLLLHPVSYLVFSITIDPSYFIDIKFGYEDVEVDLVETDWRT